MTALPIHFKNTTIVALSLFFSEASLSLVNLIAQDREGKGTNRVFFSCIAELSFSSEISPVSWFMMRTHSFCRGLLLPLYTVWVVPAPCRHNIKSIINHSNQHFHDLLVFAGLLTVKYRWTLPRPSTHDYKSCQFPVKSERMWDLIFQF